MAFGKPFTLYTRQRKTGNIYYVKFKQPNGTYSTAKSTGQTSRKKAEAWSIGYLQENAIFKKGQKIRLKDFSSGFFALNGEWATDKKVLGKTVTQRQCDAKTTYLSNHILPVLGEYYLNDISNMLSVSLFYYYSSSKNKFIWIVT